MSLLWSVEKMEDAKHRWEFIMLSPINISRINIIDIHRIWMTHPEIVLDTTSRLAGTKEEIIKVLSDADISDDSIQQLLNESLSIDNYEMDDAFFYNKELNEYNLWKLSVVKSNIKDQGLKLFNIMSIINPNIIQQNKPMAPKGLLSPLINTQSTTIVKGKGRVIQPLIDKIDSISEDKVLDISKLVASGAGTISKKRPIRSKNFLSPNLPLLSGDLEHFIMAIDMLPGGRDQYAIDIQAAEQFFSQIVPEVQSIISVKPQSFPSPKQNPPLLKGRYVPQPEHIIPEIVHPIFTKGQYAKRKILEEKRKLEELESEKSSPSEFKILSPKVLIPKPKILHNEPKIL